MLILSSGIDENRVEIDDRMYEGDVDAIALISALKTPEYPGLKRG